MRVIEFWTKAGISCLTDGTQEVELTGRVKYVHRYDKVHKDGRWQTRKRTVMYMEVKGWWFFNRWVNADTLECVDEYGEVVWDCLERKNCVTT